MSSVSWKQVTDFYAHHSDDLIGTSLSKKIDDSRWDKFEIATVIILSLGAILVVVFSAKTHDAAYLGGFVGAIGGAALLYLAYRIYNVLSAQKEIKEDEKKAGHPLLAELCEKTLDEVIKKDRKLGGELIKGELVGGELKHGAEKIHQYTEVARFLATGVPGGAETQLSKHAAKKSRLQTEVTKLLSARA